MSAFEAHRKHARETPDAVGRGVIGDDPDGPATLFVLAGPSLGATAIAGEGNPRWYDLRQLVSLDALGDDVDGRVPVEAEFDDGDTIRAQWPEPFCDKVVTRLRELLDSGQMAPRGSGAAGAHSVSERSRNQGEPIEATSTDERDPAAVGGVVLADPPASAFAPPPAAPGLLAPPAAELPPAFTPPAPPPAPIDAEPPSPAFGAPPPVAPAEAAAEEARHVVDDFAEAPSWSLNDTPLPGEGPALATPANEAGDSELVLHDVVYHGGYPGQTRKRKKCTAVLNANGLAVSGPAGPDFRLGWDVVTAIEAQNADEAKFRLNIRPKRNSTALVFDCQQGVAIVLEARDVPTLPLKGALNELLAGRAVRVA